MIRAFKMLKPPQLSCPKKRQIQLDGRRKNGSLFSMMAINFAKSNAFVKINGECSNGELASACCIQQQKIYACKNLCDFLYLF